MQWRHSVLSNSVVNTRSRALHYALKAPLDVTPKEDFWKMVDHLTAPRPWDAGYPRSNEVPAFSTLQRQFDPATRVLLTKRPEGVDELRKVLDTGYKISSRHDSDLLAWAMEHTTPKIDTRCIELLIEHGASTKYVHAESGESLIVIAIRTGKGGLVKSLVRHQADVSHKDKQGRSPLLVAVQAGASSAVTALLTAGAASQRRKSEPSSPKTAARNGEDAPQPWPRSEPALAVSRPKDSARGTD